MYKIKWLSANEIKAVHQYLPTELTAQKKYNIVTKTSGPLMSVYENESNELLLFGGINAFNALSILYPSRKVPCRIISYSIQKSDWYDACLLNCVKENIYYKVKDEIILAILASSNNNTKRIADLLNCSEDYIRQHYIINQKVPKENQKVVVEKRRTRLVNSIYANPNFSKYQHLLLYSATSDINRLTLDKLKYFKWYINAGYSLNMKDTNLHDQLYEFNKVVDLKEAFNTYWLHLDKNPFIFSIKRKYNHNIHKKNRN